MPQLRLTCSFTWFVISLEVIQLVSFITAHQSQQRAQELVIVFDVREVDGPVAALAPPLPAPQILDLRERYLVHPNRQRASEGGGGGDEQLRFQVLDTGPSGQQQQQQPSGPLQLNASGQLSVGPLDREDPGLCSPTWGSDAVCVLSLRALVWNVRAGVSDALLVLVNVSDVDDHAPRWPAGEVRLEVPESDGRAREAGPGPKWVPGEIPLALDADEGENAAIRYSIVGLEWHEPGWPDTRWEPDARLSQNPFRLIETQDSIRLQLVSGAVGELDRERRDRYRFRVQAEPINSWRHSPAELSVLVDVLDVNDNRPVFADENYHSRVREDVAVGSFLEGLTLGATDPDAGQNGELHYSVVDSESTCKTLAVDTIAESKEGTRRAPEAAASVARVQVMRALDFEMGPTRCVLVVRATDLGAPTALSSTARVLIDVQDVNDNDPHINVRCRRPSPSRRSRNPVVPLPVDESLVALFENVTVGTDVPCGLRVSDPDFGPVTCSLDDISSRFLELYSEATSFTSARDYRLQTLAPLDRETFANTSGELVARVRCSDSGGRTGEHRIRIALLDVNDNAPAIALVLDLEAARGTGRPPRLWPVNASTYALELEEDDGGAAESGTRAGERGAGSEARAKQVGALQERALFRILATDPDEGASGNLEYHLVVREQSDAPLSSQDQQQQQREAQWSVRADGRVVAAGALDREVRDSYVLALLASDRGDPPLSTSASVLVRLLDRNDEAPDLSANQKELSISEGVYLERVLLATVGARDLDAGENGTVHFSIEQCDKSAPFVFPPAARASSASASALASAQASLLLQQPQRLFTIDEESGKLWLLPGELDREALPDPGAGICVRVRAADMGRPTSRSSMLDLVLEVLDVNDNPPRLESNRTLVCGAGCAATGLTLRATDPDSGPNGTVVYTLANPSPLFSMDRHTGTLTLAPTQPLSLPLQSLSPSSSGSGGGASGPGTAKLDPLLGPQVLHVNLSDCGSPARSSVESITVLVTVDAIALAASSEEPNFARIVLMLLVLLALLLFLVAFAVSFAVCRILQRSQHSRSHENRSRKRGFVGMGRAAAGQSAAAGARNYRDVQDGALLGRVGVGVWCDSDAGATGGESDRQFSQRRQSDGFGLAAGTPSTPNGSSHVFAFDLPPDGNLKLRPNRLSTGSNATAYVRPPPRVPSASGALSAREREREHELERATGATGLGLSLLRAGSGGGGGGAMSLGHSPACERRDTYSLQRDRAKSCRKCERSRTGADSFIGNTGRAEKVRHSPPVARPASTLSDRFDRELLHEYRGDTDRAPTETHRSEPNTVILSLDRAEERNCISNITNAAPAQVAANGSTGPEERRKVSHDSLFTQHGSVLVARGAAGYRENSRDSLVDAGASRSAAGGAEQQRKSSRDTLNLSAHDSVSVSASMDGRRSIGAATIGGASGGGDAHSICERRSVESLSICSGGGGYSVSPHGLGASARAPHQIHQQHKLSDPFLVVPLALANLNLVAPANQCSQRLSPIQSVGQSDRPVFASSASPSATSRHSHTSHLSSQSSHSSLLARLSPTFSRSIAAAASEATSAEAGRCSGHLTGETPQEHWRERSAGGNCSHVEIWPNPPERECDCDAQECVSCSSERRAAGVRLQRSCDAHLQQAPIFHSSYSGASHQHQCSETTSPSCCRRQALAPTGFLLSAGSSSTPGWPELVSIPGASESDPVHWPERPRLLTYSSSGSDSRSCAHVMRPSASAITNAYQNANLDRNQNHNEHYSAATLARTAFAHSPATQAAWARDGLDAASAATAKSAEHAGNVRVNVPIRMHSDTQSPCQCVACVNTAHCHLNVSNCPPPGHRAHVQLLPCATSLRSNPPLLRAETCAGGDAATPTALVFPPPAQFQSPCAHYVAVKRSPSCERHTCSTSSGGGGCGCGRDGGGCAQARSPSAHQSLTPEPAPTQCSLYGSGHSPPAATARPHSPSTHYQPSALLQHAVQSPPPKHRFCGDKTGASVALTKGTGLHETAAYTATASDSFNQCNTDVGDTHRTQSSNELSGSPIAQHHESSFGLALSQAANRDFE